MGKVLVIKKSDFSKSALGKVSYLLHSSYEDVEVSNGSGCAVRREGLLGYTCFDFNLSGKTLTSIEIYSVFKSTMPVYFYKLPKGVPSNKIQIGVLKTSVENSFNKVDLTPTEFAEGDVLMAAHDYNQLLETTVNSPLSIISSRKGDFVTMYIGNIDSSESITVGSERDSILMYRVYGY